MPTSTQIELINYTDSNGKQPFIIWLESLDNGIKHRVLQRVVRLESGNFGDHKFLEQGVYELKLDFGAGYRIYFGRENHKIIILLSAGSKRTQKRDIEKALKYWKNYKEESND